MLHDALVESLEARREESEPFLLRELFHDLLRQLPALRGQRDDPVVGHGAVGRVESSRDDVDPEQHPRAAAVRLVVHLPGTERRRVAVGEQPEVELGTEHRGDGALFGEPREGVGNEGEYVQLHGATRPRLPSV